MTWKKIWYFLWKDDSLASWIVNVILAFVLIKFIIYPGLGLLLGTPFPIVAVVSGSMEHDITKEYLNPLNDQGWTGRYEMCGNVYEKDSRVNFDTFWQECGSWYEQKNITKEQFRDFPLHNGFNKGDIIILYSKEHVDVGDVIVFQSLAHREPIIHRVVQEDGEYMTKGDHNSRNDDLPVDETQILGKALFKVPFLGWVKILFVEFLGLFGG